MATISLTVDAQTGQRILYAFGQMLECRDAAGKVRDATLEEVKAYIVGHVRALARRGEQERIASEALDAAKLTTAAAITIT